jgi:Uncharacterized protein conserved in cyanobacteria
MISQVSTEQFPITTSEQDVILPGWYSWQQFKALEAVMEEVSGVKICYLDGCVELMTLSENHEMIKSIISLLLGLYFLQKQIEFIPVGSATRSDEMKAVSFEPDESYYLGEQKEHPDLAIEVIISSGNFNKLEKYKRFKIPEVWFWRNDQLSIYRLNNENYEEISHSDLLPELDINLFVNCVKMPSKLEAMTTFLQNLTKTD